MKYLIVIVTFFYSALSYAQKGDLNLKDLLTGESYIFINSRNDTMHLEFSEDEVKNYSFGYIIINPYWHVKDSAGEQYLKFEGDYFKLLNQNTNNLKFSKEDVSFCLIKQSKDLINLELLEGYWVPYWFDLNFWKEVPPPPCPGFDSTFIPNYKFQSDTLFKTDLCYKQKCVYYINSKLGYIDFGYSTNELKWKITYLSEDVLIYNREYTKQSAVKFESNIKLKKYVPNSQL